MKPRPPQLPLRFEAEQPGTDADWCAGAGIVYLGATLTLVLDTACREPARVQTELHLPLPPAATPRQIRDAAESWLREEALRAFATVVAQKSALTGRQVPPGVRQTPDAPTIVLAFGKRSDWVRRDGNSLRCHWRLIEQPPAIIEQVLARALAALVPAPMCDDLFAMI